MGEGAIRHELKGRPGERPRLGVGQWWDGGRGVLLGFGIGVAPDQSVTGETRAHSAVLGA